MIGRFFKRFTGYFIPAEDKVSAVEMRKARFLIITLLITLVNLLMNGIYFLVIDPPNTRVGVGTLTSGSVLFSLLLFYRSAGRRILLTNLLNILSYGMIGLLLLLDPDGIYSSDQMILIVLSAWTFLIAGKRSGIAWFVVSIAIIIANYVFEVNHVDLLNGFLIKLPPEYNLLNYISGAVFLLLVVYTHEKNQDSYISEINEQKKTIEEKNKDILDSMHYAKRIQRSQLPTEKYVDRKLRELIKN